MEQKENLKTGNWIWLREDLFPQLQNTFLCHASKKEGFTYGMAEFQKHITLKKPGRKAEIQVSGDTFFRFWLNGEFVGKGPVCGGGDFIDSGTLPHYYANHYVVPLSGTELLFFAQVQLSPVVLTDYSRGHGGFLLNCTVTYEDGSCECFGTDESWLGQVNYQYTKPYHFDGRLETSGWEPVAVTKDIWQVTDAPIPMLEEKEILPSEHRKISVPPCSEKRYLVPFSKIYAGYVKLSIACEGECSIRVRCCEVENGASTEENMITDHSLEYRSFQFHSIGLYEILVQNNSAETVEIIPSLIFSCYPVADEGSFRCSDKELEKVYEVSKWTLQICRQTLHLDSPRHQEPLACTGDYYIESLMTAFCFGDMRLAAFDVQRTADLLIQQEGRLFHTSYSLIWVQMLYDVYRFTGDQGLLRSCQEALRILLKRFQGYLGENGLLEHAPDYMFVDWMVVDGYSLHHPPKALGQTCLNAFYHGALKTAAKICFVLGDIAAAECYEKRAQELREACEKLLFDGEKGLYFDGLDTPSKTNKWLPENIHLKHYSKHSNILAVLYGLCEEERAVSIMEQVVRDNTLTDCQPYFTHFYLEALKKTGLFSKYGMSLLGKWKEVVKNCDKGLQEGWYLPEEGYSFDYSHAWGGTPAYQLPCAFLGFRMEEAGFKRISFCPQLFGLPFAEITMPTPYGMIYCKLEEGKPAVLRVPEGISYELRKVIS